MPLNINLSRETKQKIFNTVMSIIIIGCVIFMILGYTVFKPKPTPPQINPSFVVAQDGSGDYTTISAAVHAAPSGSSKYFGIFIKPGVYLEKVFVPFEKTRLAFIGAGMGVTVISSNGTSQINSDEAATVMIKGYGFVAMDISFENTGSPTTGYTVALANKAQETAFQDCSFKGYSGVLNAGYGPQFYGKSHVYGAVDVIWGNAAAVFQKCAIYVEKPLSGQQARALTSQQRGAATMPSGFVFHGCSVVAAAGYDQTGSVFLGRPGGPFATVVFMECYLGGNLRPSAGWLGDYLPPKTLYLAEYKNGGPGADSKKMITPAEAAKFTVQYFIGEKWLPKTTVGYVSGFL